MSFQGRFEYCSKALNFFNASETGNTLWNSTININQLPEAPNIYNQSLKLTKPKYWHYVRAFNNSDIYYGASPIETSLYILISNISNDQWSILYNQSSPIQDTQLYSSSDQTLWAEINNLVNITDYINVSLMTNNSNGLASLQIKTNSHLKLFQTPITYQSTYFPLWRPDLNTTAQANGTQVELRLMVKNGTLAGFQKLSFEVISSLMNISLLSNYSQILKNEKAQYQFSTKNHYNGEKIDITSVSVQSQLESDQWEELDQYTQFTFQKIEKGVYNVSLLSQDSYFFGGEYKVNITFHTDYFFDFTIQVSLNISKTGTVDFEVDLEQIPVLYPDDTSKTITLNLTYDGTGQENARINAYLGGNVLVSASQGDGIYRIFLDSSNLLASNTYEFNITIRKANFTDYFFEDVNVNISYYPSQINVPDEYIGISLYQEQIFELIVILKDPFRERDILSAQVRMKIEGEIPYSEYFEYLAGNFGWYRGTLEMVDISPGNYEVTVEMSALNYQSNSTTFSITVLERKETTLNSKEELNDFYVWGDSLSLSAELKSGSQSLSDEEVIFRITKYYEGGSSEVDDIVATTDNDGIATVVYIIEELDALEIEVIYDGKVEYKSTTMETDNIDVRSTAEQAFLNFLPFIPVIIGAVVAMGVYYVRAQRKKRRLELKWKRKARTYKDIMNIQYLLILHKYSGRAIVQEDFGETGFDGTLVGGFLQAITSFIYGLEKKKVDGKEQSNFLFDHQNYKILLEDGEFVRIALILDKEPSQNLRNQLSGFIQRFEEHYSEYLEDFDGVLKHFKDYITLSSENFRLTLTSAHVINPKLKKEKLNDFEKDILNFARTYEVIAQKAFTIKELRKYLLGTVSDHSEEEITATLLELLNKNIFIPLFETEPKSEGKISKAKA
ncbi:MAG: hypothetical protein EU544_03060 [Promethearchaeota archaeon]|nr:MAG: hypothetical protein EU544_03060 [Candidatus Lokiarchaeota archaeon]